MQTSFRYGATRTTFRWNETDFEHTWESDVILAGVATGTYHVTGKACALKDSATEDIVTKRSGTVGAVTIVSKNGACP